MLPKRNLFFSWTLQSKHRHVLKWTCQYCMRCAMKSYVHFPKKSVFHPGSQQKPRGYVKQEHDIIYICIAKRRIPSSNCNSLNIAPITYNSENNLTLLGWKGFKIVYRKHNLMTHIKCGLIFFFEKREKEGHKYKRKPRIKVMHKVVV